MIGLSTRRMSDRPLRDIDGGDDRGRTISSWWRTAVLNSAATWRGGPWMLLAADGRQVLSQTARHPKSARDRHFVNNLRREGAETKP